MLGNGMGSAELFKLYAGTGMGSIGLQIETLEQLAHLNAVQTSMINSSRLHIPIDFTAETLHSGGCVALWSAQCCTAALAPVVLP